MENIDYFFSYIHPEIAKHFSIIKFSYKNGQFGDLDRVEIESPVFLGTIDFWSQGWLGIHLVDLTKEEEVINVLLSPEDSGKDALLNFKSVVQHDD